MGHIPNDLWRRMVAFLEQNADGQLLLYVHNHKVTRIDAQQTWKPEQEGTAAK